MIKSKFSININNNYTYLNQDNGTGVSINNAGSIGYPCG